MTTINTGHYVIDISIGNYIGTLCKYASNKLDRKLDNFSRKYRCGEYGEIPMINKRLSTRDEVETALYMIGGVKRVRLNFAKTFIPITVTIDECYEGIFYQEILSDIAYVESMSDLVLKIEFN